MPEFITVTYRVRKETKERLKHLADSHSPRLSMGSMIEYLIDEAFKNQS